MTPELTSKTEELEKMEESGAVREDVNSLMLGKTDVLPLDDRNFERTASKISVLKTVLEELSGSEYQQAKDFIDRKFL